MRGKIRVTCKNRRGVGKWPCAVRFSDPVSCSSDKCIDHYLKQVYLSFSRPLRHSARKQERRSGRDLCVGWVDPRVGLGWVGNGSEISVFSGSVWVMGLTCQICEKRKSCIHVILYRVSTGKFVLQWCIILMVGQWLFDIIMGFSFVRVGLDFGSISSSSDGMSRVGSGIWCSGGSMIF